MLVNFSLMDDRTGADREALEVPRVVLLARVGEAPWRGGVEQFQSTQVKVVGGSPDLAIAGNKHVFERGCYRIAARSDGAQLAVDLRLRPLSAPALASSVRLSPAGPMRWLVVPRLVADGWLEVDGKAHRINGALAYHDRNWGHFDWGGNFGWEWAVVLPDSNLVPWNLVYMRIGDRSGNQTFSKGLMLWRGENPARVFTGDQLAMEPRGMLETARFARVPPITRMLMPGAGTDVPRSFDVRARAFGDEFSMEIDHDDFIQVAIPNDGDDGLTLLSEVGGRARVSGLVGGEYIEYEGNTVMEFNHGAH
jgi:hypothetical protein